jgi:RNA polymerase sigma factor (sigma-70 family)
MSMAHVDRFDGEFEQVLDAAQRGAPAALERIYTTLAPIVVGYLRAQAAVEPEDLCSEVFVAVVRNLARFEGDEAGFRSWVFTIAHRRLIDERRMLVRRPQTARLDEALDLPGDQDVEDRVEHLLGVERVRALCDELAPDQRDVLLLRLLGRLTIDEIAALLGKTPGAVKALQRRGFRALYRMVGPDEHGGVREEEEEARR